MRMYNSTRQLHPKHRETACVPWGLRKLNIQAAVSLVSLLMPFVGLAFCRVQCVGLAFFSMSSGEGLFA